MHDPIDLDMSADQLLPSSSSAYDLSREPEVLPRVGDAFQAEFPQLVSRSDYLLLHSEGGQSGASESFGELSVPVLLPSRDHRSTKGKAKASKRSRKGFGSLVPLSEPACWTDMEKLSFLVGLYIFQKNFVQLTEFMETKSTGDIMAYYYGRFYHSQEYSRWSDTRKLRSRRCIFGHKMFTGTRQQELLARLFNNASEDCKTALTEVSKSFGEGKIPLSEYVSSMKGLVGLNLLVEAVGIGKGRQDLTGAAFEPSRASLAIQIRPEIPTGKACANLAVSQIVQYLTGDYRKSKTKFTDFFFEAVWPRLLARGWISEEPKDPGYPVAVHTKPFVFLVPGVQNIARRRLLKGVHFYDSISDVLSKVAKDPSLMELDAEGNHEGIGGENVTMLEEDDAPTRSRRYYLQPRTTTRITPGMRFTIVDASSDGDKAHMLKELKVPEESNKPAPRNLVRVSDEDAPKAAVDNVFLKRKVKHEGPSQDMINAPKAAVENVFLRKKVKHEAAVDNVFLKKKVKHEAAVDNVFLKKKVNHEGPSQDMINLVNGVLLSKRRDFQITEDKPQPVNNSQRTDFLEEKSQKKPARKRVLSQKTKDDHPVNKRPRRLTVCNQLETSSFSETAPTSETIDISSSEDSAQENALPACDESMDISSPEENAPTQAPSLVEAYVSDADDVKQEPERSSQNQPLIDLNIPVDDENDVLMEDSTRSKDKEDGNLVIDNKTEPNSDQQNQQRRGTRNRPPTSRALEALANGFLSVHSRGRRESGGPRSRSAPRPSRQARGIARLGIGKTPLAPIPEESKTPSVSSKGGQSAAGSDPDKVQPGEFEVLSAPASEN